VADPLEIEVKIRIADPAAARRAILRAGGVETRARHFEENRIFDTAAGDLVERSVLLRLRETGDGAGVLTWKEKVETDLKAKVRRELETKVSSPPVLATILERAGFRTIYRYQKYRTVFALGDATVDLDETPMGCFLEIEAAAPILATAAARLGFGEDDFLVEDYRTLYREWLQAQGRPFADMIFPEHEPGGSSRP